MGVTRTSSEAYILFHVFVENQRANRTISIDWLLLIFKHYRAINSIHANALGNGSQWMKAQGWSAYTSKGQTKADILAECLYDAAATNLPGKRIRTDSSDGDRDWEENFYILRHSICPAVLTENLFMDNPSDCTFLLSPEGQQALVDLHVD